MLSSGPYIALAALVVAVALAGVLFSMSRRQTRLEAGQRAVLGTHNEQDLVAHALELEEQVRNLREAVTILSDEVERYRHDLDAALSRIAVVRFDAFHDSGGEQSASIALLDSYRSGVVISVFAAREFARIYVKYLDHGVPDRELAPEEEEAVRRAVPQALSRGELSRAPVSSFPHDVRWAVEQVRQTAAQAAGEKATAQAADEGPAGAQIASERDAAGRPDPGPVPGRPPRDVVSSEEAELGFDWVETVPGDRPADDTPVVETTNEIPGLGFAPVGPPPATPVEPPPAETAPSSSEDEPPAPTRPRTKKDADWLGGEDLDF